MLKSILSEIARLCSIMSTVTGVDIEIVDADMIRVAGSTMLGVILPPWVHDGGTDKLLERLASPEARVKMTKDIWNGIQGRDNFVAFAGLDGIFVTDVKTEKNHDALGRSLVQLGEMRGKEPLEAAFDLLSQESNAVGMVDFYGLEEHVKALISRPEHNVCTDGLHGLPGRE